MSRGAGARGGSAQIDILAPIYVSHVVGGVRERRSAASRQASRPPFEAVASPMRHIAPGWGPRSCPATDNNCLRIFRMATLLLARRCP